jgi:phenylpropionate dioxygenase-like ring-hydroxylating dioxygenase large terminal subunit|tara:strand:+ start:2209 stop:2538 length:330 start_codon:yes stop_codon:yes gene_type:complete
LSCLERLFVLRPSELPLEKARALPAAVYTSEDYFEWEKESLLKTQWLSVVHVSQVSNMGDYINLELLGERLSVIHGNDGEISVLSRVCAHRGMDVMPPESGHSTGGNCQ